MSILNFLFVAVFISLTGVMAPGPVTFVTIGKGSQSPHAGALVAIGHGVVEIPLMISIFFGFGYILNLNFVKTIIPFLGGQILLIMGFNMFRNIEIEVEAGSNKYNESPFLSGILLSLGNPYFLIWWATLGAALILKSVSFGIIGFLIFASFHFLCDFLWYDFLSTLSFKGGQFFGKKFQRVIFSICGVFLLFFGGKFIFDALKMLFI